MTSSSTTELTRSSARPRSALVDDPDRRRSCTRLAEPRRDRGRGARSASDARQHVLAGAPAGHGDVVRLQIIRQRDHE